MRRKATGKNKIAIDFSFTRIKNG